MLTDKEIAQIAQLQEEVRVGRLNRGLTVFDEKTSPNYKILHKALTEQEYDKDDNLVSGARGVVLEGTTQITRIPCFRNIIYWSYCIGNVGCKRINICVQIIYRTIFIK